MSHKRLMIVAALAGVVAWMPIRAAWACGKEQATCGCQAATLAKSRLAAKCACEGKSDCTCKKGECKCKKCDVHRQAQPGSGA